MVRKKTAVRRKAAKPAKKSPAVRRAARPADGLNPEDVSFLVDRLEAEERSERVWKEMTAASDEADPWHAVEEQLSARADAREDHQRRWKFFGK